MSNKTFKKIMLICFLVVIGSIGACMIAYNVTDPSVRIRKISDKYFTLTSSFEENEAAIVIGIPYAEGLTESMILRGIRSICHEINVKKININKSMLVFKVYEYDKFKRTDLYTAKISSSMLYNTEWSSITKYDELRTLIKR